MSREIYSRKELERLLRAKAKALGYTAKQTKLFIAKALENLQKYRVRPQ
jgi:hypothetical protein